MRIRSVVAVLLFGSGIAAADPAPPSQPAPEEPPPEEPAPPVPPITIHITNNNSNTNTSTNTNDSHDPQPQDNPQIDELSSRVTVPASPSPPPPLPAVFARDQLSRPTATTTRWISLAATGDLHAGRPGLRASIDLLGRRGLTLGLAGVVEGESGHRDGDRPGAAAIGYVAYTGRLWGLDLRAQVGVGAALGRVDAEVSARTSDGRSTRASSDGLAPRGEAALLVGLPLGRHLGLIAGPVVSTSTLDVVRRAPVEATMTGGVRWRF